MNFIFDGEEHFFSNMRSEIESFARAMKEREIRPECEVYNISMLEEVEHLIGAGLLDPPYVVNFVLHTPTQGGLRGTPENLVEMLRRVEARLGLGADAAQVNVTSCGPTQNPITTMAMAMGLNVRVGMEDNVFFRRGELVADNRQLVERTVRIARELDREPATPDEARELLGIRSAVATGQASDAMTARRAR
jgi:3-keto-5-aminohexanoate cleavage enzyme